MEINELANCDRPAKMWAKQSHAPSRFLVHQSMPLMPCDCNESAARRRRVESTENRINETLWGNPLLVKTRREEFVKRKKINCAAYVANSRTEKCRDEDGI